MSEVSPSGAVQWASAANKAARPFLTVLVAVLYNFALLVAICDGTLPIREYILAVGPVNAMVMGFWFGERAAMNRKPGEGG